MVLISLRNLRVLCASVVKLTTETQRTQRLRREEKLSQSFAARCILSEPPEDCLIHRRLEKEYDQRIPGSAL